MTHNPGTDILDPEYGHYIHIRMGIVDCVYVYVCMRARVYMCVRMCVCV